MVFLYGPYFGELKKTSLLRAFSVFWNRDEGRLSPRLPTQCWKRDFRGNNLTFTPVNMFELLFVSGVGSWTPRTVRKGTHDRKRHWALPTTGTILVRPVKCIPPDKETKKVESKGGRDQEKVVRIICKVVSIFWFKGDQRNAKLHLWACMFACMHVPLIDFFGCGIYLLIYLSIYLPILYLYTYVLIYHLPIYRYIFIYVLYLYKYISKYLYVCVYMYSYISIYSL